MTCIPLAAYGDNLTLFHFHTDPDPRDDAASRAQRGGKHQCIHADQALSFTLTHASFSLVLAAWLVRSDCAYIPRIYIRVCVWT